MRSAIFSIGRIEYLYSIFFLPIRTLLLCARVCVCVLLLFTFYFISLRGGGVGVLDHGYNTIDNGINSQLHWLGNSSRFFAVF